MFYTLEFVWQKILNFFNFTRKQEEVKKKEYPLTDEINITEIFANRVKNHTVTDRTVKVIGTSKRAEMLQDVMKRFNDSLGKITAMSLGWGGVVVAPYVAYGKIYFDLVVQDNVKIDIMHGNDIYKCVINADRFEEKNSSIVYYLFAYYELKGDTLIIQYKAQKGTTDVPLDSVPQWADYPEQVSISGMTKMPFAFIKCPKDNKKSEQIYGVPITYGCENIIGQVKKCLNQFEDEFDAKETKIFVDDILFGKDKRLDKVYQKVTSDSGGMIDVYSPEFRQVSYIERLYTLFELLEKKVGTSSGILTKKETQGAATATEIKSVNLDTFSLVSEIHVQLERGIIDFIDACNVMANYYSLSQLGDYETEIVWDYSLIENSTESFNQLMQGQSVGAISKAEIRQFVRPAESIEEAQAKVDEIAASEPAVTDNFALDRIGQGA